MKFFENRVCRVATLHRKEEAIRPPFESILGLKTIDFRIDTDQFGTFSRVIERKLSPVFCAKEKCLTALKALPQECARDFLVASEGSFGSHPLIPFARCGQEILYFMNSDLNYELVMSEIFLNINFFGGAFLNMREIEVILDDWKFPSHALVVRPNLWNRDSLLFNGVSSLAELESCFETCKKISSDSKVWIETDMRAHQNPTRMQTIGQLAEKLAHRLTSLCPACNTPGWGVVRQIPGLCCSECGCATDLIEFLEFGCCKCKYLEKKLRDDRKNFADPQFCPFCNP